MVLRWRKQSLSDEVSDEIATGEYKGFHDLNRLIARDLHTA